MSFHFFFKFWARPTEAQCKAGGKPSTWFPPGGLVEQRKHADKHPTPTNKHNDKAREHPNEKQKWRSKTQKGQPRTQCTKSK